jgi:hypothetical protein
MNVYRRLLANIRLTDAERERAEQRFQMARSEFGLALNAWEAEEAERDQIYGEKLRHALQLLNSHAGDAVHKVLQRTVAELRDHRDLVRDLPHHIFNT